MALTSTGSARSRSFFGRAARGMVLVPLGLVCLMAAAARPSMTAVHISEIAADPGGASGAPAIELFNAGSSPVSLNGAAVVAGDQVVILKGLADTAPGGIVLIRWNQEGASGGSQFFTGKTIPLDPARGSVELFRSDRIDDAGEMLSYIQWGRPGASGDAPGASLAGQAGLWDPAAFLSPPAAGQSLMLLPGGDGRTAADWTAAAPTLGAPNRLPAPGFAGWSLVSITAVQAPVAVATSAGLELISLAPGGGLRHDRRVAETWTHVADLDGMFSRPPALGASANGTLDLVGGGSDGLVLHDRFEDGQWRGFAPTGGQTALPAALAVNEPAGMTELVIVGSDGKLQHSRFDGATWSALGDVGAASRTTPALGANPAAGSLELLFSDPGGTVFHARFDGSGWSPPVSTADHSLLPPALAVRPDGSVDAAISATDGSVCVNHFQAGAWQGWLPIAGAESDLSPTLVYNPASHSSELFFVGRDHMVRQARRTAAGWGPATLVGAVSDLPVTAVASASGAVDLIITGRDGALWQNRFQAGADELKVSFASDVQPIFNARCSCHVGGETAGGLDLEEGSAYDDTVGAPSFQVDMNQIEPGAPDQSYLLHKVSGTQLDVGGTGGRMPLGRPPLTADQLDTLRRWIEQGAANN
jgi:hypothetical protein